MGNQNNSGENKPASAVSFTELTKQQKVQNPDSAAGKKSDPTKTWSELDLEKPASPEEQKSFVESKSHPDSGYGGGDDEGAVLYEKAMHYFNSAYDAAGKEQPFSLEEAIAIVNHMVALNPYRNLLFIKALHMEYEDKYVDSHSVNVAIFAIKLGEALSLNQASLVELGITALLHDIGSAFIPDEVLFKKSRLDSREWKTIQNRPNYTARILHDFSENHPYLPEAAAQVYERIDGSGYPRGLQNGEIHPYAQIIGLVDVYEALIHERPQRLPFLHFNAIKEIIKTCKPQFRRQHLKALLNIFSIFPIYSYVQLNSGAICRVVETYPDQPMRPKLQVLYDSQKHRVLTDRFIDLPQHPLLYIVDALDESGITKQVGNRAA